jgi:hypothetical protein
VWLNGRFDKPAGGLNYCTSLGSGLVWGGGDTAISASVQPTAGNGRADAQPVAGFMALCMGTEWSLTSITRAKLIPSKSAWSQNRLRQRQRGTTGVLAGGGGVKGVIRLCGLLSFIGQWGVIRCRKFLWYTSL